MAQFKDKKKIQNLLKDSIVQLCKVSVGLSGKFEVDGLIVITSSSEESQMVVRIHEVIGDDHTDGEQVHKSRLSTQRLDVSRETSVKEKGSAKRIPTIVKSEPLLVVEGDSDCNKYNARNIRTGRFHGSSGYSDNVHVEEQPQRKRRRSSDVPLTFSSEHALSQVSVSGNLHSLDSSDSSLSHNASVSTVVLSEEGEGCRSGRVKEEAIFLESPLPSSNFFNTEVMQYQCNVCHVSIQGYRQLSSHCMAEHSRYACDYCGLTFSQNGNKERHRRKHTGEMPYKCRWEGCDRAFSRKENYDAHISTDHHNFVPNDYLFE